MFRPQRLLTTTIFLSAFKAYSRNTFTTMQSRFQALQNIIGTDAGNRGMKSLIVQDDLWKASQIFGGLQAPSTIIILSGFPCCVDDTPPTETDGPPGAFAIARAGVALGHKVVVATDQCNHDVFATAMIGLDGVSDGRLSLESFTPELSENDESRLNQLASACNLLIACERAGPGKDGACYTMRGINMNAKGLIAPLHRLVKESNAPFLAIGDGGNELGMGKVIDKIINNPKISNGEKIGCVVPADHLIAASVSNWGGYALAAGVALVRAGHVENAEEWLDKCLPSEQDEIELLNRCVAAGCRDGVSGKIEATVDGMPLETSLQCLRDIRAVALGTTSHEHNE